MDIRVVRTCNFLFLFQPLIFLFVVVYRLYHQGLKCDQKPNIRANFLYENQYETLSTIGAQMDTLRSESASTMSFSCISTAVSISMPSHCPSQTPSASSCNDVKQTITSCAELSAFTLSTWAAVDHGGKMEDAAAVALEGQPLKG